MSVVSLFILCICDLGEGVDDVVWRKTPFFVVAVCLGLLPASCLPSFPLIAMMFIREQVDVG